MVLSTELIRWTQAASGVAGRAIVGLQKRLRRGEAVSKKVREKTNVLHGWDLKVDEVPHSITVELQTAEAEQWKARLAY